MKYVITVEEEIVRSYQVVIETEDDLDGGLFKDYSNRILPSSL